MSIYRSAFVADQIARRPREARRIRRILDALSKHGHTIDRLDDGEEITTVHTVADVLTLAFNLDEWTLFTTSGAGLFVVMGEADEDMLVDYSMRLDDALGSI